MIVGTLQNFFILPALSLCGAVAHAAESLPFWNDTTSKNSNGALMEKVAKEGSFDYFPPAERIAVFDNNGTLRAEQLMYFQLLCAITRS